MLSQLSLYQKIALCIGLPASAIFLFLLFRKQDDIDEDIYATTSRQAVVEVSVPKEVMSALIGRQGINIKQIQDDTKTRIFFKDDDENSDHRIAIIKGREMEQVYDAQRKIQKTIALASDVKSEEVLVPQKSCGRLIGRNGDTIRSMCRESRAKIFISSNPDAKDSNGNVKVQIKGTEDQILVAKGLIEEKLASEDAFRRRLEQTAAKNRLRKSKSPALESDDQNSSSDKLEVSESQEKLVSSHSDGYLEVYISSVDTVSHFWIQVVGSKAIHLDKLIEEMTRYYSTSNYHKIEDITTISVGDIVAAPFPNDDSWYRGKVIAILGSKIIVHYVDFGDTATLKIDDLRTLRSDFLSLPFQAIECYLANVKPAGGDWSKEAVQLFESLTYATQWKVIMSRTVSYQHTVPFVELINTHGEQDICINKELVKRGYAVWEESKLKDSLVKPETTQVNTSLKGDKEFQPKPMPKLPEIAIVDQISNKSQSPQKGSDSAIFAESSLDRLKEEAKTSLTSDKNLSIQLPADEKDLHPAPTLGAKIANISFVNSRSANIKLPESSFDHLITEGKKSQSPSTDSYISTNSNFSQGEDFCSAKCSTPNSSARDSTLSNATSYDIDYESQQTIGPDDKMSLFIDELSNSHRDSASDCNLSYDETIELGKSALSDNLNASVDSSQVEYSVKELSSTSSASSKSFAYFPEGQVVYDNRSSFSEKDEHNASLS